MKKSPEERKLEQLEVAFRPLLIRSLRECYRPTKMGFVWPKRTSGSGKILRWKEAAGLREIAPEIRTIKSW
jgi:hypothetical protein